MYDAKDLLKQKKNKKIKMKMRLKKLPLKTYSDIN